MAVNEFAPRTRLSLAEAYEETTHLDIDWSFGHDTPHWVFGDQTGGRLDEQTAISHRRTGVD